MASSAVCATTALMLELMEAEAGRPPPGRVPLKLWLREDLLEDDALPPPLVDAISYAPVLLLRRTDSGGSSTGVGGSFEKRSRLATMWRRLRPLVVSRLVLALASLTRYSTTSFLPACAASASGV